MSTKFSGSLDDFRLWNKKQTSESIYNNYYRAIGGGANSDDNRTELAVYYKFNEGTLGEDSTDRVVLDYSGRIANGYWEEYSSDNRETGSAYTTDGDPIVRSSNTLVTNLESEMETSGTLFDSNNSMSLFDLYPQWIQEEDNGELRKLTQIIAAYFDDLYAKIEYLPNLKDKRYFKDSEKPLPFAKRLLEEKGLIVPDILVERSILEFFGQRDLSRIQYEKDIEEVKNKIYQNIYNNIEYIYKSKGTEKAYRNLLRCFGIDDEVVKLNLYTDNGTQYLVDKTKHTSEKTKHIDFDDTQHFSATVYQQNYISGSGTQKLERYNAITAEAEVLVPRKPKTSESWYYSTPFQSASVFGLDAADDAGTDYDMTITGSNFQTYLVRDSINSDRAKWVLERNTITQALVDAELDLVSNTFLSSTVSEANSGNGFAFSFWFKPEINESGVAPTTAIIRLTFSDGKSLHIDYTGLGDQIRLKAGAVTTNHRMIASTANPYNVENFIVCTTQIVGTGYTTNSEWTMYYYSGGTLQSTSLKADTIGVTNNHPNLSTLTSVSIGSFASLDPYDGTYDDVMVWDKHLSATDVQNLYDLQSGTDPSKTILTDSGSVIQQHWKFAESLASEQGDSFTVTGPAVAYINQTYTSNATGEILLESDFYDEIYNNQRWNIAVRVSPEGYPFAGSFATSSNANYNVEFYGVTHNMDEVLHEFDLATTLDYNTGSALLAANKKLYVGARRTTWTGSVETKSDLKIAAASVYYDKLDNKSIKQHNLDPTNYGHNRVHSNPTPFIKDMENVNLPAQHTLALHWDFQTVTSSDSSGEFVVEDFSSASSESRYDWLDQVVTNEYKGIGYGFSTSSSGVVRNEFIFASKKELPEISFTSDSIQIIGDEENFLYEDQDVNDNVFAFEKSMYQSVSEEMLNMFSTITEYANLISKPVDRYRVDYKRLALARQLFFEKVDGNMDLDRFTDYFKWIDASISVFLQQLHPANAKFNKGIADMVESHILERPKYQHIYPFVEKQTEIKTGQSKGPGERLYNWKTGHSPDYKLEEYNDKSIQIEVGSFLEHSNSNDYTTINTIAFWINPADTTNKSLISFGSGYKIIFDSNNLTVHKDGVVSSTVIPIAGVASTSFVAITLNTATVQYSVNGAAFAAMSFGGGGTPTITGKFIIGADSIQDKFDEITLWNKVLSNAEVLELYNSGIAINVLESHSAAANVVSYYRMGDHPNDPEIRPFQGYEIIDSAGNYNLQVKGTWSSYAASLAGSFKIEQTGENIHCLWQKERKEHSNTTRQFVQKALTSEAAEIEITLGDNTSNSYVGSTYASRRFAKPYRFKGEEQRTIHGGINYAPSKDRDFLKSATHIHGQIASGPSPVPQEVVTIGAGLAQGLIDQNACDDAKPPTKKEKLASNAVLGKFSDYSGTGPVSGSLVDGVAEYAFSVKGERILPMNIVEGTSITGYNETIHYNFRENVIITNLHSDTTSPTNDIPMQSPFTETWVGGRQSRHVPINRGTDDFTTRPEEWRLLVGEHEVDDVVDGALGFTGPDYGGVEYPNPERTMAIYYRDERAKRPINAANRKTTDLIQGNFSNNYEIVQTVGRLENNVEIRQDQFEALSQDIGLPTTTNEVTFIGVKPGTEGNILSVKSNRYTTSYLEHRSKEQIDFSVPENIPTQRKSVFASRFSAPGGFDVMSEAFLDAYGREYSVYNSTNFRNYSVIEDSGEASGSIGSTSESQTKAIRSQVTGGTNERWLATTTLSGMPTSALGFSVSTWIKLDNSATAIRHVYHDDTRSGVHGGIWFQSGELYFRAVNSGGAYGRKWTITYSDFLSWIHIAVAWDGDMNNGNVILYINGVSQGTGTNVLGTGTGNHHSITDLYLFDKSDASANFELQGAMQEFTLWNKELTSGNVTSIYNAGEYVSYSTLAIASDILLWYRLGEEGVLDSLTPPDAISHTTTLAAEVAAAGITGDSISTGAAGLQVVDGAYTQTISSVVDIEAIRVNSHNNRREGLNTLHQRHCGQFGLDSTHGSISSADYDAESSFHKIHRNTVTIPTSGSTRDIHNNFYIQSPIPASDYNYSWVTSSLGDNYSIRSGTQKVYGYWPKTGILSSSSGFDSAIVFPTASEIFGS